MSDLPFTLAFNVFPGIGPVRFKLLYEYFGSAEQAWNASTQDLLQVGLSQALVSRFQAFKNNFSIDQYLQILEKKHIRVVSFQDSTYPFRLKEIPDAPYILYVYGEAPLSLLSEIKLIGVVGTRMITNYGREVTQNLVRGLVKAGYGVVSGLALGVDTVVHETTLANQGKTIAVLGCGVDLIAPASNAWLYYRIVEYGGLIISEMPIQHRPEKKLFPVRNRIISGLSIGIVVTEGAEKSGSLITASYAAMQGREVFAVPGPITSLQSKGTAALIKNGATLVESVDDILINL